MDLSETTRSYKLQAIHVSPAQLFLDPRNPRLISDNSEFRNYADGIIASPEVQEYVLDLVCQDEHDVKRLIDSIKEIGFISGLHEMIVKPLRGQGKYLVLEGNRRTAALRHLLLQENFNTLPSHVQKSIEQVEVKVFSYVENKNLDEDRVIEILLGTIHIDGPKEWGALERAHYIARSYQRELASTNGGGFYFDSAVAKRVGKLLHMSPKTVELLLCISRVYQQLKEADFAVTPAHYTLLELTIRASLLAEDCFGLDPKTCDFSQDGLERFNELFIDEGRTIYNPLTFRQFSQIHQEGTDSEWSRVFDKRQNITTVYNSLITRRSRSAFCEQLEAIHEHLDSLTIDGFQGTMAERRAIKRIHKTIEKKFLPLANN